MRRLLLLIVATAAFAPGVASAQATARPCGRTGQGAYVTVAKGGAGCREARELLHLAGGLPSDKAVALYLPSGTAGVTNTGQGHWSSVHPPLWTCSGVTSLPHSAEGIVCKRGPRNEIMLRFPTRAEIKQEEEDELALECEKETFLSLECENAGFTEEQRAKKTPDEKEGEEREAVQRSHEVEEATRERETGSE
jgi:hypothetical protein